MPNLSFDIARRASGLRPATIHALLQAWIIFVSIALWTSSAHAVPIIDEPAPPLKGVMFDGTPFDLNNYKGKVVMVNFFSSFCKICAYEIGNVETYYDEFKSQGLEVIALSIDRPDDKERSARMAKNYNLPGGMVSDLTESGFEKKYPTPTCYVFDRKGILRAKHVGAKQPTFYREVIRPLLKE